MVFQAASTENGEVDAEGTVAFYGARLRAAQKGVEIVSVGQGKMADAGAKEGGIILFVNGDAVAKPSEVVAKAKKGARAVYIEGIDANGKTFYLAFGK